MTMRHRLIRGSARRGLAMFSAAAMLSTMLAVPALAEHYEDATVLEGDDAIEAALAWSGLSASSDAVAIGRNDVFADNLSSGLIQGLGDGVQLLLTDTDSLDSRVADEIERLGATVAHVLGGEAAISADVEDELEALGLTVHRHAGTTRVETAIDIASKHATDATSAILARSTSSGSDPSQAFADSLAAGAWAAESGMPVLLTQTEELNDNLAAYLEDSAITAVTIVGGTSAVSAAVASDLEALGIDVDRVSGATRFETAVAIAEARGFADSSDATDGVIVVEGQDANSWAGGFAAAKFASNPKPIVLANGDNLPAPTEDFLSAGGAELFCGPLLNAAACDAAAEALGLDLAAHTNQAYTVTPGDSVVNTVSAAAPNENRGARSYTVSGLDNSKTYRIELIPATKVVVAEDGTVTFVDTAAPANQADDLGNTTARIEVVNGASTDNTDEQSATPVNGSITFVIDSLNGDQNVRPVVFQDADNDGELDLTVPTPANTTPKQPSEPFAVGGAKQWVPVEAQGGVFTIDATNAAEDISVANKDLNAFVGDPNTGADNVGAVFVTYYYDSNDTFRVNGVPVTMEAFEKELSQGDGMLAGSTYAPDPAAVSVFDLDDTEPVALTVGSSDVTTTSVELDLTGVDTANNAVVKVYGGAASTDATMTRANAPLLVTTSTDADTTEAGFQVNITNLSANTRYEFWATQTVDGDESTKAPASDTGLVVNTGAAPAPISTASNFADGTNGGNSAGILDANDSMSFQFDRAVTVASNATLKLIDDDGTAGTVTCGSNATCTVSGTDSNILTVVMSFAPTIDAIGGTAGLDFNSAAGDELQVRSVTGISNTVAGWNLAASGESIANRTRVVAGTNADLAAGPDLAEVTPTAATDVVALDDATCDQAQLNDVFNVYDAQGRLLGSATVTDPGADSLNCLASVTTNRDLVAGENVFYTITDSSGGAAAANARETISTTEAAV